MKNRLKQRIFALSLLAWTAVCPADAQQTRSLRDQFLNPSDEAKPWTFWYWMYGAVSKEGITADLEAMKHAGLGGTYLMPIKGIHEGAQYDGKAQQLTPEWWEMVRFSMEESDRLGLKLGMHIVMVSHWRESLDYSRRTYAESGLERYDCKRRQADGYPLATTGGL